MLEKLTKKRREKKHESTQKGGESQETARQQQQQQPRGCFASDLDSFEGLTHFSAAAMYKGQFYEGQEQLARQ